MQRVKRWTATLSAVAVLVFGLGAVPAYAYGDNVSVGRCTGGYLGICFAVGINATEIDSNATDAPPASVLGHGSATLQFQGTGNNAVAGTFLPPDPTEFAKVGVIWECDYGGGDYSSDGVWSDGQTWGWWDLNGLTGPKLSFFCRGGTVSYLSVVQKVFSEYVTNGEPADYDIAWESGTQNCAYSGSYRECMVSGTGAADEMKVTKDPCTCWSDAVNFWFHIGASGPVGRTDIWVNQDSTQPPHILGNTYLETADPWDSNWTFQGGTYHLPIGDGTSTDASSSHYFYLYTASPSCLATADAMTDATQRDTAWRGCWAYAAYFQYNGATAVTVVPGCGFLVTDPATWGDPAQCEAAKQLQQANVYLSQIASNTSRIGTTAQPSSGGGGATTPTDTSGCGSGVITSLICLTKNIADAIAGLTDLLKALFAPSQSSFDAMNNLSTDFTGHPPGSIFSGAATALVNVSSGLSDSGCSNLPALDFGSIHGLEGTVVTIPSMCDGGTAFGSGATLFQAAYDLMTFFVYGLLAFGLWRMASQAFGGGKDDE